jgi:NADPH-dependent 7-cyano-7-deazaguanine reductase QueF-like protein
MNMKTRKFKVDKNHRKSELSEVESKIEVEVVYTNPLKSSRIYDNVHFPNKFANKIFERNSDVERVIIRDLSDASETIIVRPNN